MKAVLLNRILIFLGFVGLGVAGYLTMAHWMGAELACIVGSGCGKIANSPYSWLPFGSQGTRGFGIPVAFPGFLTYALLTALAITRSLKGDATGKLTKLGAAVSGLGFIASGVLMFIAFNVVQATCTWCITSAVVMTITFLLSMMLINEPRLEKHHSSLFLVPVAAVAFGLLGWQAVILNPKATQIKYTTDELTPKDPKIFGVTGAKVVIVEFADLTCPHCKESYNELKRLLTQENAQFEVVFRSFPLRGMPGHEMGLPAAVIGELVAEKGSFFQYVDLVFGTDVQDLNVDKLLAYAKTFGVDPEEAKKRILDEKDPAFRRFKADSDMGDKLGILQTPTYFIGERGKKVYMAKQNSYFKVMSQPDLLPLWDSKMMKK